MMVLQPWVNSPGERSESSILICVGQKLDAAQAGILLDTLLTCDANIQSWSTMNMMGLILEAKGVRVGSPSSKAGANSVSTPSMNALAAVMG